MGNRIISLDPRTAEVTGVVAEIPPGLEIGKPQLDQSGDWIAFGDTAANAQNTNEGEFILHDGRSWRVPGSDAVDDVIWR